MDSLYQQIFDNDYLKRYHACQQLLEKNNIHFEVSELRQVFPWITVGGRGVATHDDKKRYQVAVNNLQKFITHFGVPLKFESMSKEDLNERLLDTCYYVSPELEVIKNLVSYGADINALDSNGYTAFIYASKYENYEIMKYFLESGADPNTPLPLPQGFSRDFYTSVFLDSIKYTKPEFVELLLNHGADITIRDDRKNNCLHVYSDGVPDCRVISRFIDLGVPINDTNGDGDTVLHIICYRTADGECLKRLLDQNAMVNATNNQGRTPLHNIVSSYQGTGEEVELLVKYGASINLQDRDGNTPLHLAVMRKNRECVKPLLQHGASVNIKNSDAWTPYQVALSRGFMHIAEDIGGNQAHNDYKKRPEYRQLQEIKKKIVDALKQGSYKLYCNKDGSTRLYWKDDYYQYDCYTDGKEESGQAIIKSDDDLLRYMYEHSMLRYNEEYSKLDIFTDILESLKK